MKIDIKINRIEFKVQKSTHTSTCAGMYMFSHVQLFATPWTVACQAPLSLGFPRQKYWSRLPFPPPGHQFLLDFSTGFPSPQTSLVAQTVKRLSTMQETWVRSLGQEDLLEKEMVAHSSILAWKIPWTMEPGRLLPRRSQRVGTRLSDFTFTFKAVYTLVKITGWGVRLLGIKSELCQC